MTGVARPDEIVYNRGARAGDALVLTKPLGLGVLASALKKDVIGEDDMLPAIEAAAALNAAAAEAMQEVGAHACTDVTGFGLLGHLSEMLEASGLAAQVEVDEVPLHDRRARARSSAACTPAACAPTATGSGRGSASTSKTPTRGCCALFDPQTSGGLLVAAAGGAPRGAARRA